MSRAKCRNRSLFAHFDLRSILFDYAFGTEPWTIKKKKNPIVRGGTLIERTKRIESKTR